MSGPGKKKFFLKTFLTQPKLTFGLLIVASLSLVAYVFYIYLQYYREKVELRISYDYRFSDNKIDFLFDNTGNQCITVVELEPILIVPSKVEKIGRWTGGPFTMISPREPHNEPILLKPGDPKIVTKSFRLDNIDTFCETTYFPYRTYLDNTGKVKKVEKIPTWVQELAYDIKLFDSKGHSRLERGNIGKVWIRQDTREVINVEFTNHLLVIK